MNLKTVTISSTQWDREWNHVSCTESWQTEKIHERKRSVLSDGNVAHMPSSLLSTPIDLTYIEPDMTMNQVYQLERPASTSTKEVSVSIDKIVDLRDPEIQDSMVH
jgi:hypothetical protein